MVSIREFDLPVENAQTGWPQKGILSIRRVAAPGALKRQPLVYIVVVARPVNSNAPVSNSENRKTDRKVRGIAKLLRINYLRRESLRDSLRGAPLTGSLSIGIELPPTHRLTANAEREISRRFAFSRLFPRICDKPALSVEYLFSKSETR